MKIPGVKNWYRENKVPTVGRVVFSWSLRRLSSLEGAEWTLSRVERGVAVYTSVYFDVGISEMTDCRKESASH